MVRNTRRVFATRGVFYLLTRLGGSVLRRRSFDEYYRSGQWDRLDNSHSGEIVKVVEKYARRGRILDMGCGTGILAARLADDSFEYYRGIDASSEAIALARKRAGRKVAFEIGDIQSYRCEDDFDCIVFEDSLYYVLSFRYRLLKRYAERLRPGGVFVVTVADPRRFSPMVGMIRKRFEMVEDRLAPGGARLYLVFH
jgi:SAM-dependent methyltransferase